MPFEIALPASDLTRLVNKRLKLLVWLGFDYKRAAGLVLMNLLDNHERRSSICVYEHEQARHFIKALCLFPPSSKLGPWFCTIGDPKLRLRPCDVGQFDPKKVLRRWRSAIQKLRRTNPNILGLCVVELQLCRLLDRPGRGAPRYFYEPHFHCLVWGASEQQVKDAFKVRLSPSVLVRKRAVKVQWAYDVPGALAYMTKFRTDFRKQWSKDANSGWARNNKDIPTRHLRSWFKVMSRFKVHELLSATGFSLADLGRAGVGELATGGVRAATGHPLRRSLKRRRGV